LYKPFGIAGLVIGTAAANAVMTWLQLRRLRAGFNGRLELDRTLMITVRILAATVVAALLARLLWAGLNAVVGGSLVGQLLSVGVALAAAGALYARLTLAMRITEARQIEALVRARLVRG
jgi:putative peptidoglycan lipid II flippase